MKPEQQRDFLIDHDTGVKPVLETLQNHFTVESTEAERGEELFLDSFDWRLYRRERFCCVSDGQLVLRDFDGRELHRGPGRDVKRLFWWELEDANLAGLLEKTVGVRALVPVLRCRFESVMYRLLNRDRKTVARLRLVRQTVHHSGGFMELPESFRVSEVRGYQKQFHAALDLLCGAGAQPLGSYRELIDRAFGIGDRQPLDYGAKFELALDPEITIGGAVATICLDLVAAMEVNRPGVCEDIDTEFLHDFRIAVRRTRSLISLLRKVLPAEPLAPFEREFKWLGTITGPLRDIDVYLLERQAYQELVVESLAGGLEPFFSELAEQREKELECLRQGLSSERYRTLIESWRRFLSEPKSELFSGRRAEKCRPLVSAIIRKRFRSFLKHGERITPATPDEQLHRLRIKGKKFRYLLEFFRSFYDRKQVELFLKHMKKLQDNLGDFNDLSVQTELIQARLDGLRARNRSTIMLAAALGSLVTRLEQEHRRVRAKFAKTYRSFNTEENRQLIAAMTAVDNQAKTGGTDEDRRGLQQ